jgi:DNA-binding response OmpR family regulator
LRETLVEFLADEHGFATQAVATLGDADSAIKDARPDAIILDLGLPDGDGLRYCVELRKRGHTMPIIILTGSDLENEGVQGLESGANDYITKPFRSNELAVRLRTQLRLFDGSDDAIMSLGPFIFRPSKRQLYDPAKKWNIRLTDKETMILKYLFRADGSVDCPTLLKDVWGYHCGVTIHAIETHIYRLRQKIEVDPSKPRLLVTDDKGYSLRRMPV